LSELKIRLIKDGLRERVWRYLEDNNLARFPRTVYRRIPNFVGAEKAAASIRGLKEFSEARVVKVNPDAPQLPVRRVVLEDEKILLMPTPRLKGGFLKLDPRQIPRRMMKKAVSISGAFQVAKKISITELPKVDLIVAGSVAVSQWGGRIGKGEGYSELEYGILMEYELLSDDVRVVTTVHDSQIVEPFPLEKHDLPLDYILTPTKVVETNTSFPRPKGIYWDSISSDMLNKMPILNELRNRVHPK
jgi:5-formyltetrahydrofolate cyclo-ligase